MLGLALMVSGCTSSTFVVGNVASMIATMALFYSTLNLVKR